MDGSTATIDADLAKAPPAWSPVPARALNLRDWFSYAVTLVGMFMALLDVQIVSSSLAELQAGLSASPDEIGWVQTSYLMAEVVMIPLSGYLSRMMGTRLLFTLSALGFTLMSLACAQSESLGSMILFRAAQGFLGGAMIPTVFSVAFGLFPAEKRALVSTLAGLVATMAPTLGPTIGGYLTQTLDWHWLFLINVGPGLAVALAAWLAIDFDRPNWSLLRGFDIAGFVLMAGFLGPLEYVLEEGPRYDWLSDGTVLLAAVIGVACGIGFFWRVLTAREPIVDLRSFTDRNFAVGTLYSFVIGIGLYGAIYLVPAYLARVKGFNSLEIGEMMAITGIAQFISAPIAGALAKKVDPRLMLGVGFVMFAIAVYINAGLTVDWSYREFLLPQALRGFSIMLCFVPINTLALGTLPLSKLKNASGLYNLSRNLGGAIGLALINTMLIDRMQFHWNRLAEGMRLSRAPVDDFITNMTAKLGDTAVGDPTLAATKRLAGLVAREAMVLSFADCLLAIAAAFILALLLLPLVRKPGQAAAGGH